MYHSYPAGTRRIVAGRSVLRPRPAGSDLPREIRVFVVFLGDVGDVAGFFCLLEWKFNGDPSTLVGQLVGVAVHQDLAVIGQWVRGDFVEVVDESRRAVAPQGAVVHRVVSQLVGALLVSIGDLSLVTRPEPVADLNALAPKVGGLEIPERPFTVPSVLLLDQLYARDWDATLDPADPAFGVVVRALRIRAVLFPDHAP